MKLWTSKNLLGITVVGLVILFGASSDAMGQGRGRRVSRSDKKCEKFVNCHDARDGRVGWTRTESSFGIHEHLQT